MPRHTLFPAQKGVCANDVHTTPAACGAAGRGAGRLRYHRPGQRPARGGRDYTQGTVASEASGREAVTINQGQYVEFTLPAPANSINVHYHLPAGSSGRLSFYVNGSKLTTGMSVTSRHMGIDTPNITGSKTHHFFDDSRLLLGQNLGAGAKVRVQANAGDVGQATIDLADFEQVAAPSTQPANSLSVTDYGAVPNSTADASQAFNNALAAARSQGKVLWVPAGRFEIGSALAVDQTTVRGAGPWYTVLHGNNVFNNGSATGNIHLSDFAIFGDVTQRNDSSPDTMADGINFDGAVTNSTLHNNYLRNNGDDGLALWSNGQADSGNTLSDNTVVQPNLANGIALYGGSDNTVTGNLVQDTNALGGGIAVANRFSSVPLGGTITLSDNTTLRAGALDPNWKFGVGALWFDARDEAITGATIKVTGFHPIQSPYEAFQFIDGNGAGKAIQGVTIDGASVQGTGTYNCPYPSSDPKMSFSGNGNSGWTGIWPDCATWPPPNSGPSGFPPSNAA